MAEAEALRDDLLALLDAIKRRSSSPAVDGWADQAMALAQRIPQLAPVLLERRSWRERRQGGDVAGIVGRRIGQRRKSNRQYPEAQVVQRVDITSVVPPNLAPAGTYQATAKTFTGVVPDDFEGYSAYEVTGRTIAWASSDAAVFTVNASTGLVTAVAAGTANLTATSEGCNKGTNNPQTITVTDPQSAVASIDVTPATATINVSQTIQVQGLPKDASGNVLTGKTVTWATDNAPVATVGADSGDDNHTATVTGVAAGTATITGTSAGFTDACVVTVVASGSTYFTDGFESGDFSANQGGFRWCGACANGRKNVVVTSAKPRTGIYSAEFTYVGTTPEGDSHAELGFQFGQQLTEFWMRWWLYIPDGTEGLGSAAYTHRDAPGADNNKFLALWDEAYVKIMVGLILGTENATDGGSFLTGSSQITYRGASGSLVYQSMAGSGSTLIALADRGTWVKFQVHVKLSSDVNTNNAICELWKNDTLIASKYDFRWFSDDAGANNYFRHGYLLGWSNSGFDATTKLWVDDVKIASAYITD